ncbi:Bug family tripartite tricarboxylate transporter substrate binding protein [Metabacillus niabensis]|uniref:Bug family tripartite tricarboxylate transporter substrate binding protein n=1 Tax=Metabacillus niabensis TaxID=324854 RepID=UPI001CF9A46A|nr:tripartite tricarboxylate transporter substrate binding protein [Metabacillus niabensis]
MKTLNFRSWVFVIVLSMILTACNSQGSNTESNQSTVSNFPEEPVKIVVPFAAGGAATTTARLIADASEESMGNSIVVENREGGGGTIGQQNVSTAKPDGYTLLLATNSLVTNPIFNKTSFTHEDFEPILQLVSDVSYLFVSTDAPYDDFGSFIEYAKENPGEVSFATSGAQASDNFAALDLIEATGIDATTIPYDGAAPAVASVAGGHDEVVTASFGDAEGQVQAGNLKPILVLSENKSKQYPDVPTSFEEGYEITDESWRGLVAPKGTDPEVVKYLQDAFKTGFDSEDFQKKMANQGMETVYKDSQEFKQAINDVFERYDRINKEN